MSKMKIFVDRAGQYRWRLVAANGEIVAASEAYTTKQSAIRSANNVKALAGQALIEDKTIVAPPRRF